MRSKFVRLAVSAGLVLCVVHARSAPALPAPRVGHVMTSAGSEGGVYLVGGGSAAGDPLWRFADGAWRELASGGPVNRSMVAGAFDTRRRVLVVFGGVGLRNGSRYGDTWEWNGTTWSERDVPTPGARDHHAMAFDEARGQMVMYGGWGADHTVFPGDTWTWDGVAWKKADDKTGPGGVGHQAMAYDSRRERVVMYGGDAPGKPATNDLWEWNGTQWERIAVDGPGPGARTRHRLAFDAARGVIVLYGGSIGSGPTAVSPGDTWTWDGKTWKRFDVPGPPARYMPAMAYDAKRQRVVLFGGGNAVRPWNSLSDTWEWDGASWKEIK